MTSLDTFILDPSIFNTRLYTNVLTIWLPTYPNPSLQFDEMPPWFTRTESLDSQCRGTARRALESIGPEQLPLPPFVSHSADRDLYAVFARPFVRELDRAVDDVPETTTSSSSATETKTEAGPATDDDDKDDNRTTLSSPEKLTKSHTALALAILLDQFPRNIYRANQQGRVYTHYDRLARAVTAHTRAQKLDHIFADAPLWRYWFYIPLEHSEHLADHEDLRVALETMERRTRDRGDDELGTTFISTGRVMQQKHEAPLAAFGRYPWRNRWLGRENTEAEQRWLDGGGDTFGTG